MVVAFSGCIFTDELDSIDRAINVIDRGIYDINTGSANWRTVLERVANDLPEDISATIRNDAQSLATRSIASAGVEARCDADFFERRAVQSLENLKAELLGTTPPLLPPHFCQMDPSSINMIDSPRRWPMVILYGYDLDHRNSTGSLFKFLALDNRGATIPIPEDRIGRTTHYQVTLNLRGLERWFYEKNIVKVIVEWNGSTSGNSQVLIIPWTPDTTTEYKNIGFIELTPENLLQGDADFDTDDDEAMEVTVKGHLYFREQYIHCMIFMEAYQEKSDYTILVGNSDWNKIVYTPPDGWKIINIRPKIPSTYTARITEHGSHTYFPEPGGVVKYFEIWGDHKGDDVGYTKVKVYWNELEITLEETVPEWY